MRIIEYHPVRAGDPHDLWGHELHIRGSQRVSTGVSFWPEVVYEKCPPFKSSMVLVNAVGGYGQVAGPPMLCKSNT